MAIVWEDYNLPSFIRGSKRAQPIPFRSETPFVGNSYVLNSNDYLQQLPVRWSVSLKLTKQQAIDFNLFLDDLYNSDDLYFEKTMYTEVGNNVHSLTIVGGRPQGTTLAGGMWSYSFELYSKTLDLTVTPVPPIAVIPPSTNSRPTPEQFQYMPPDGLNTDSGNVVDSATSRDNNSAIVVTDSGGASITNNGGELWRELTNRLNSGSPILVEENNVRVAMSDNGQVILYHAGNGYLSLSTNGGDDFSPITPFYDDFFEIRNIDDIAMNGSGNVFYIIMSDGELYKTSNRGGFFTSMGVFGSTVKRLIETDRTGNFVYLTIENMLYKSDDGFESYQQKEISDIGFGSIDRLYVSSDGSLILFEDNLFRPNKISNDFGETFFLATISGDLGISYGGKRSMAIDPNNRNILAFISTYTSLTTVAISKDDGRTWSKFGELETSEAEGMIVTSCASSTFWMAFSNGNAWVSSETYVRPEAPTNPYKEGRAPTDWVAASPRYLNSGQSGGGFGRAAISSDGETIFYGSTTGSGSNSFDTGETWSQITDLGFGVESTDPSNITVEKMATSDDGQIAFAVARDGYIMRTLDKGVTWEELQRGAGMPSFTNDIDAVCCSADGQIVFAGGASGQGGISYNAGDTWISVDGLAENLVLSSAMSKDGQTIMTGHYGGYATITRDAGATWIELPRNLGGLEDKNIESIVMSYDGLYILAAKDNGELALSSDNGITWSIKEPSSTNLGTTSIQDVRCGMSYDGKVIVLGAVGGYVSYSDDYGVTFNTLTRGLNSGSTSSTVSDIVTNGDVWMVIFIAGRASISKV